MPTQSPAARLHLFPLLLLFLTPTIAFAEQPLAIAEIGLVTAVQGDGRVARPAFQQESVPLHFRDSLFSGDRITTGEGPIVGLLLGGSGSIMIHEGAECMIEMPTSAEGSRRTILHLSHGRLGVATARDLVRLDETIEVETPNAVAAGGVALLAEYLPASQHPFEAPPILLASSAPGVPVSRAPVDRDGVSSFLVHSVRATITPAGQAPLTLAPLDKVRVGTVEGVAQAGPVQVVKPPDAGPGLTTKRLHTAEPDSIKIIQTRLGVEVPNSILAKNDGRMPLAVNPALTAPKSPNNTVAPVVPRVQPARPPPSAPVATTGHPVPGGAVLTATSPIPPGGPIIWTGPGSVFTLNNSILTVRDTPLLSNQNGGSLAINGDFVGLTNGSKITVQGGPLISVSGTSSTGAPSTLNISGALVNFGGTGGNRLIINNNIVPTTTLSGIAVNKDSASSIAIGPDPINNLGTLGAASVTGSVIRATGGGKVTITAP